MYKDMISDSPRTCDSDCRCLIMQTMVCLSRSTSLLDIASSLGLFVFVANNKWPLAQAKKHNALFLTKSAAARHRPGPPTVSSTRDLCLCSRATMVLSPEAPLYKRSWSGDSPYYKRSATTASVIIPFVSHSFITETAILLKLTKHTKTHCDFNQTSKDFTAS